MRASLNKLSGISTDKNIKEIMLKVKLSQNKKTPNPGF